MGSYGLDFLHIGDSHCAGLEECVRQRLLDACCRPEVVYPDASLVATLPEECAPEEDPEGRRRMAEADGKVRSEARQLLSSWLHHEEEASLIERRARGHSDWPDGDVTLPSRPSSRALPSTKVPARRPPLAPHAAVAIAHDAQCALPGPSSREGPRSSERRAGIATTAAMLEGRLRTMQGSSSTGDVRLREDVEVTLGLLAERRTTTCAATACSSTATHVKASPRTGQSSASDPLLRMNARQETICAQRAARQRAPSVGGLAPPSTCTQACTHFARSDVRAESVVGSSTGASGDTRGFGAHLPAERHDEVPAIATRTKVLQTRACLATQSPDAPIVQPRVRAARLRTASQPATVLPRRGSLEGMRSDCADAARENKQLEEQVGRARGEVVREAQAYRKLLAASRTQDRHKLAMRQAEDSLKHLHKQRAAADSERRATATGHLVLALDAARRRHDGLSKRAVLWRLQEARAAVLAKLRLAAAGLRVAQLGRCTRAWHVAAAAERVEREATHHAELLMREQRQTVLAVTHHVRRCLRRLWLAWRVFLRHVREERAADLVQKRTRQFIESQAKAEQEQRRAEVEQKEKFKQEPEQQEADHSACCFCSTVAGTEGNVACDDLSVASPTLEDCGDGGERFPALAGSSFQIRGSETSSTFSVPKASCEAAEECRHLAIHLPVVSAARGNPRVRSQPRRGGGSGGRCRPVSAPPERPGRAMSAAVEGSAVRTSRNGGTPSSSSRCTKGSAADVGTVSDEMLLATSAGDASGGAVVKRAEPRHPKVITEMERRAAERRRVAEERREWHRRRDLERMAQQREAEEMVRLQQEEDQRRRLRERRDRERSQQRHVAERLVMLARQREQARRAHEFWKEGRLVVAWCALRQVVIEAEEMQLVAWRRYRSALQRRCFEAWRRRCSWDMVGREACLCARARIANWFSKRRAFRTMVSCLECMAGHQLAEASAARRHVEAGMLRRCAHEWRSQAAEAAFDKGCMALWQYARQLTRRLLALWVAGVQQSKLDSDIEMHKQALREKVCGWLREIDHQTACA